MNNLTLKIGDSFNLPIQFYDAITGDGFEKEYQGGAGGREGKQQSCG